MDITEVAKTIRAILKTNFPATKFSVKSSRFSQGSSVDVSWTDGPTVTQVDKLIGKYGNPGSRFITTSRKLSHGLVNQAIKLWKEQNPEYAHFSVICRGEISCYAQFNLSEFSGKLSGSILQICESSLNEIIYGSTFDGVNLIRHQDDSDNCQPEVISAPESESVKLATDAEINSSEMPNPEGELLTRDEGMLVYSKVIEAQVFLRVSQYKPTILSKIGIMNARQHYCKNPNAQMYRLNDMSYRVVIDTSVWYALKIDKLQPQEPAQDLTLELIDLQKLLISKLEEVNQLKLKIAELQVERDTAKYNQQQPKKAKLAQIILTRDEGTIAESGTTATATDWLEAEQILKQWAVTVSSPTRADKCKIVFKFSDGESFKLSSFELMQRHRFRVNLAQKVLSELQYMASKPIPAHMTQQDYELYCTKFGLPNSMQYKRLLDNWEIPA